MGDSTSGSAIQWEMLNYNFIGLKPYFYRLHGSMKQVNWYNTFLQSHHPRMNIVVNMEYIKENNSQSKWENIDNIMVTTRRETNTCSDVH